MIGLPPAIAQLRASVKKTRQLLPPGGARQGVGRVAYPNNGTLTGSTRYGSRLNYVVPPGAPLIDPRVFFGNFSVAHNPESDGANSGVTIRAAIEYPIGTTLTRLYCRGSIDMALAPGATGGFDASGLHIPAGAAFRLHVRYIVATTSDAIYSATIHMGSGDAYLADATTTDNTAALGATYTVTNQQFSVQPLAVLGRAVGAARQTAIAIVGDSIASAVGDTATSAHPGFVARAIGTSFAYGMFSKPGMLGSQWGVVQRRLRALQLGSYTHAICNMGANDVGGNQTLAAIQASLTNMWQQLSERGMEVWQSTLSPQTTSTDAWATVANQTPVTNWLPGGVGHQVNDWIRTMPAPLSGFFETADAAMTARNSGVWKAGYCYPTDVQGIHPSANGHAAMAAVLQPIIATW